MRALRPRTPALGGRGLLLALLILSATACGPKKVLVNGVAMDYEQAAGKVLKEGQLAQRAGDRVTAEARFGEVLRRYADSEAVPGALLGMAELVQEDAGCAAARPYWEQLSAEYASDPRAKRAEAALEACPVEAGAVDSLKERHGAAATPEERLKIAQAAAAQASSPLDALRWKLLAYDDTPEEERAAARPTLEEAIDQLSPQDLRTLLEERPADRFPAERLRLRQATLQLNSGELDLAQETLRAYLSDYPEGRYREEAEHLLQGIEARERVNPGVVGVLLPLSGKHRPYGQLALQAIRLGFGLPEGVNDGPGFRLAVYDTASDPAEAAKGVRQLVLEEGAILILGGIFTYAAEPEAAEAQAFGVPLLTISRADNLTDHGPYVFQNGLSNQAQVKRLVDYCMDVLGMRRFAILYPKHPYGKEMLNLFWDEVLKKGGEIRGVESFLPEDTTFTGPVRRLVGRDQIGSRDDYKAALSACGRIQDDYRRSRCRKEASSTVEPITDFDALFIPAYPKQISMISAALAFEDIFVERDPRRLSRIERTIGRKVHPITLLGGSGWNSPQVVKKSGRNVENALFADAFFADADEQSTAEFVNAYRKAYGRTPRLYPEALFYDSARIVAAILRAKPTNRQEVERLMRQIDGFKGVTGETSFVDSPEAKKTIKLLTIKDGQILEIPPVQ